jgi:hypothetical protein
MVKYGEGRWGRRKEKNERGRWGVRRVERACEKQENEGACSGGGVMTGAGSTYDPHCIVLYLHARDGRY